MRLNTNPEQTQNTIITINTFLNFKGNCENVLNFYRSVFGGQFSHVGRFSGMPANPDYPVTDENGNQIKHIRLPISKECVLMGSDTGGHGVPLTIGNNFS
jgi:PhnB protein